MMVPLASLAGVPSGRSAVLDLTADLAPLLKMGLSVLSVYPDLRRRYGNL